MSRRFPLFAFRFAVLAVAVSACGKPAPLENTRPFEAVGGSSGGGAGGSSGSAGDGGMANGGAGGNSHMPTDGGARDDSGMLIVDAGGEPWPTPTFSKKRLLQASATCATLHYENFLMEAELLRSATAAHHDDPSDDTLEAARDAWKAAMARYQRVEAFNFGPMSNDAMTGGKAYGDLMYAYPLVNRCEIDTRLVAETYASDFGSLLASARGLAAIEYLLFRTDAGNACAAQSPINKDGTWDALGSVEHAARRAHYAAEAARDVHAQASKLVAAWEPSDDNFTATLTDTGASNPVFGSQQAAFNAINEALYYIELEIKDHKLGEPLALSAPCLGSCADLAESRFAAVSTDNLRQNLIGVRKLFEGCGPHYSGLAFDDWLRSVGREDLATAMIDALADVQDAIDALDPPVESAILGAPDMLRGLYAKIKVFTDLLKSDFITTLNLEPPAAAIGDND